MWLGLKLGFTLVLYVLKKALVVRQAVIIAWLDIGRRKLGVEAKGACVQLRSWLHCMKCLGLYGGLLLEEGVEVDKGLL